MNLAPWTMYTSNTKFLGFQCSYTNVRGREGYESCGPESPSMDTILAARENFLWSHCVQAAQTHAFCLFLHGLDTTAFVCWKSSKSLFSPTEWQKTHWLPFKYANCPTCKFQSKARFLRTKFHRESLTLTDVKRVAIPGKEGWGSSACHTATLPDRGAICSQVAVLAGITLEAPRPGPSARFLPWCRGNVTLSCSSLRRKTEWAASCFQRCRTWSWTWGTTPSEIPDHG